MAVGFEVGPVLPRFFFGGRIKLELLVLSYAAFYGVRESVRGPHHAGGTLLFVLCVAALIALKAFPGPLHPRGAHLAANFVAGAFLALLWLPLWAQWLGGTLGGLLALVSAWAMAGVIGYWHDQSVGPTAFALQLGTHLDANQGIFAPEQALRIRRGRWWSAAHADLPVTLVLNNGGTVALRVGDRYLWRTSAPWRAPDVAATTVNGLH
ncbi:MAG: hypothetical protein F4Y28_09430 [Acidimicrobiia bacterium]|nr:hypothetical protein [Acidimicrobiia bacterium]MYG59395.1 hypothetical protein [Acidimicrobiia bacterium]MYJ32689.1 hypothetical protein [Acidimicrobiia bacterium]